MSHSKQTNAATPVMPSRQFVLYRLLKRSFDLGFAAAGTILLLPVFGLVAGAILLQMGAPILYRGWRIGRWGKPFEILKFRTMTRDADRVGTSVTKWNDQRVTALGRFLRRSKLDELPQLWNVLKGEMSLVGPRPDTPEIVAGYTPEMRRVLEVRPGITSIASLRLRNEVDLLAGVKDPDRAYTDVLVPAKIRLALAHVDRRSLSFDLRILMRTLFAIARGTHGGADEELLVNELREEILRRDARSSAE